MVVITIIVFIFYYVVTLFWTQLLGGARLQFLCNTSDLNTSSRRLAKPAAGSSNQSIKQSHKHRPNTTTTTNSSNLTRKRGWRCCPDVKMAPRYTSLRGAHLAGRVLVTPPRLMTRPPGNRRIVTLLYPATLLSMAHIHI